jgi:hypothetical protein
MAKPSLASIFDPQAMVGSGRPLLNNGLPSSMAEWAGVGSGRPPLNESGLPSNAMLKKQLEDDQRKAREDRAKGIFKTRMG